MKRILAAFFGIMILLGAFPALAADENVRICALTTAFECTSDEGCMGWSIEDMALPHFVRIDFGAKSIVSLDKAIKRDDTKVASISKLEGITVLQGVELRGWSIALGENSGSLTLTASGDDEGFVVFGNCMNP